MSRNNTESEGRSSVVPYDDLIQIAKEFGTPTYAYRMCVIADRVEAVRDAFGDWMDISYAAKSNPNREILRRMQGLVEHLDVSSGGEIMLGRDAGWDPAVFTFVGPAKADWELTLALESGCGHIICESEGELRRIDALATSLGLAPRIALRINPVSLPEGFGVSMSRRPTVFGIDEERIDSAIECAGNLESVKLDGLHVYAGTQCLTNESIAQNLVDTAALFDRLIGAHALAPSLLIFGSGFGIPYHERDAPIDLNEIARLAGPALSALREKVAPSGGRLSLELGRYLVGEAGFFLTRVVSVKETRGSTIIALDGGMNHHLAASGNLGGVIKRNYPIYNVSRRSEEPDREYDLAGPMCTNIDTLGRTVALPGTEVGDVIAVGASGAYGVTASPTHFISHRPPAEVLIEVDGTARDITALGTLSNPIAFPPRLPEVK